MASRASCRSSSASPIRSLATSGGGAHRWACCRSIPRSSRHRAGRLLRLRGRSLRSAARVTPLGRHFAASSRQGPISVARYMALCLGHPRHGYYMTRDPFGAGGDFVTAPEISQMFGELLGLWCADAWAGTGIAAAASACRTRSRTRHVDGGCVARGEGLPTSRSAARTPRRDEPGPARGADSRAWPQGRSARLARHRSSLPPGPLFVPQRVLRRPAAAPFVRTGKGWCERLVGLGADGGLAFGLAPEAQPASPLPPPRQRARSGGDGRRMCIDALAGSLRQGGAMLAYRLRPCPTGPRRHARRP